MTKKIEVNQQIEALTTVSHETESIEISVDPTFFDNLFKELKEEDTTEMELVKVRVGKNWEVEKTPIFDKVKFAGIGKILSVDQKTGDERYLDAAYFIDMDGEVWYNCVVFFVKHLKDMPVGSLLKLTYKGMVKTKNGNKAEDFLVEQYRRTV